MTIKEKELNSVAEQCSIIGRRICRIRLIKEYTSLMKNILHAWGRIPPRISREEFAQHH